MLCAENDQIGHGNLKIYTQLHTHWSRWTFSQCLAPQCCSSRNSGAKRLSMPILGHRAVGEDRRESRCLSAMPDLVESCSHLGRQPGRRRGFPRSRRRDELGINPREFARPASALERGLDTKGTRVTMAKFGVWLLRYSARYVMW
jgi:hypothetical protein